VDQLISPHALVRDLSVAQQQLVEIAKALSFEARILVMDEPTAALSPHEVEALFRTVRRLRERGLAILYVSHRLKEIFSLAERITVLKDGHRVATVDTTAVTISELVRMMVGRELESSYFPPRARPDEIGKPKLRVENGNGGVLRDINFEVRSGEIVGIAGLEGSGQTELARAIFGVEPFTSGRLEVDGAILQVRSPRAAIQARMGFLTEDRKAEGLVLPLPIRDNVLLALRGLGARRRVRVNVQELARKVDLRSVRPNQEVRYLSGGNWFAPTYPTYQWRTPIIAATMILNGEKVPKEWVLPQPEITSENLDKYVDPKMPPLFYPLCGCQKMPGYPEKWGGKP
jgi:ribose transport system ATP-binding protein